MKDKKKPVQRELTTREKLTKRLGVRPCGDVDERCAWRDRSGSRFCNATSHRSCEGCSFFTLRTDALFEETLKFMDMQTAKIERLEVDMAYLKEFGG